MQLSPNFTLAEFTHSNTAIARKINNTPNAQQIEALKQLCIHVLEPLRAHYGRPIKVSSGYRSVALCKAVGSSASSQHATGEAADFEIPGVSNLEVAKWIAQNLTFDQLILEDHTPSQPNSGWIHCSYRVGRARKDKLTWSKKTGYLKAPF